IRDFHVTGVQTCALPIFARHLIAGVRDPAVSLQQDGRAEVTLAVPPVARARGLAAEAEDTLVEAVQLGAILAALAPFLGRRRGEIGRASCRERAGTAGGA